MPAQPQNKAINRMILFFADGLIAEVTSGTIRENSNNEQGHGNDGSAYYSQGNMTSEIDFQTVKPAIGYSVAQLVQAFRSQSTNVGLTGVVGDEVVAYSGTFQTMEHKGESKTGMLTGDFKFIGSGGTSVGAP